MSNSGELLDRVESYVVRHGQLPAAQYLLLRQAVENTETERAALLAACELVVAQDDWSETVSISAKAYEACNKAIPE